MKAKLLWNSWLHLVLAAMIALQVTFLWWCSTYIVPIYHRFRYNGWLDGDDGTRPITSWTHSVLSEITRLADGIWASWWLFAAVLAAAAYLFWRLRSDHKRMIGLSTLATAALGLMLLTCALSMALVIPLIVGITTIYSGSPERVVVQELLYIDASVGALEHAIAKGDWEAMQTPARLAAHGVDDLASMGAAAPAMLSLDRPQKIDRLRTSLKTAGERLHNVEQAIQSKDPLALQAAMERFREEYPPMR
jgi:hypothetical protein